MSKGFTEDSISMTPYLSNVCMGPKFRLQRDILRQVMRLSAPRESGEDRILLMLIPSKEGGSTLGVPSHGSTIDGL